MQTYYISYLPYPQTKRDQNRDFRGHGHSQCCTQILIVSNLAMIYGSIFIIYWLTLVWYIYCYSSPAPLQYETPSCRVLFLSSDSQIKWTVESDKMDSWVGSNVVSSAGASLNLFYDRESVWCAVYKSRSESIYCTLYLSICLSFFL